MNSKIKKLKTLLLSTIGLSTIALTAPIALVSCATTTKTESTNPPIIDNMSDYTPHTSSEEIVGFHGYTYPANTNFYSFENVVSRPITSNQKTKLMKGLGIENKLPAANNMKYNTEFENIDILEKLVEDVDFIQETGQNKEFISHENILLDSIDHDNVVTIVGYKEDATDDKQDELVFQMFYDNENTRNSDNILIDSDVFTFRMMFHDDPEEQIGRPQPIIDFEPNAHVTQIAQKDDNGYTYPANTKIHKYELTEHIKLSLEDKTNIFNNLSLSQATTEQKTRYNYNFKNVKLFEDIIKNKTFRNVMTNSILNADQINTSVLPSDDLLSYVGFRNREETSESYDELLLQVFPDMNNNKSWNDLKTDVFMLSIKFDESLPNTIIEFDNNNVNELKEQLIHDNGYTFPSETKIHEYSYEANKELTSELKDELKKSLSLSDEMTDQKTKYNKDFRDVNILKAIIQDKNFIGETVSKNLNFQDINSNIIENVHVKSFVGFRDKTDTQKNYDEIVIQIFPDMNNNKTWDDLTTDVFMLSLKFFNDELPESIITFEENGFTTDKETIGDNGYKYPKNTKMHTYSATIDKELTVDQKRQIIQSFKLNDELSKNKNTYYNNNFRDSNILKELIKDLTFKNVMTQKTLKASDIKTEIITNRNLFTQIGFNDKRVSRKNRDEIYVYVNPKLDEEKTWKDKKTDVFSLSISFK